MAFEWNGRKAASNLIKHGVAFQEAATVFLDPVAMTFSDPDHSLEEQREITIGYTIKGRLVLVSHCQRDDRIRIISARLATPAERRQHEQDT